MASLRLVFTQVARISTLHKRPTLSKRFKTKRELVVSPARSKSKSKNKSKSIETQRNLVMSPLPQEQIEHFETPTRQPIIITRFADNGMQPIQFTKRIKQQAQALFQRNGSDAWLYDRSLATEDDVKTYISLVTGIQHKDEDKKCKSTDHIKGATAVTSSGQKPAFVAFVGRSNVGKSSLLNEVVGVAIAKVSATPGRTQMINIFQPIFQHPKHRTAPKKYDASLAMLPPVFIIDTPGYSYGKAKLQRVAEWNRLLGLFLRLAQKHALLRSVYVMLDARQGIKYVDEEFMIFLRQHGIPFQIILTKIDKMNPADFTALRMAMIEFFSEDHWRNKKPDFLCVSSRTKFGVAEIRQSITSSFFSSSEEKCVTSR